MVRRKLTEENSDIGQFVGDPVRVIFEQEKQGLTDEKRKELTERIEKAAKVAAITNSVARTRSRGPKYDVVLDSIKETANGVRITGFHREKIPLRGLYPQRVKGFQCVLSNWEVSQMMKAKDEGKELLD